MSLSKDRKNILITNDDGIESEGLKVLAEKLSAVCNVFVMAPSSNRSAVSSKISLYRPLEFVKYSDSVFSCSGTPADCVISVFCSDLLKTEDSQKVQIDAVFSGINKGPNLGTDIVYSGTIAAARQAAIYGVPGIAVSLESPELDYSQKGFNFAPLAEFCAKNLDELTGLCRDDLFVSINAVSADEYKEAAFTSMCSRIYNDRLDVSRDGDTFSGVCEGGKLEVEGAEDCDWKAVRNGKISISLIHANPVAEKYFGDAKFNF